MLCGEVGVAEINGDVELLFRSDEDKALVRGFGQYERCSHSHHTFSVQGTSKRTVDATWQMSQVY